MRLIALGCAFTALALVTCAAARARTIDVRPGHSIQAAVDAAAPGDTVVVMPGTYRERVRRCRGRRRLHRCAVLVRKDGIKLIARSTRRHPVVLRARRRQDLGFTFVGGVGKSCLRNPRKYLHGATLAGFTVRGFREDGVLFYCVEGWRITRVRAIRNREYGIFPSHSRRGRLDHSFASGANDTGLYVGQSSRVRVDHNRAVGNVSGFEIENSTRVRLDHNRARGNTGGILSFALPELDVKLNRRNVIEDNLVSQNDRRNTCLEPEDVVCKVPRGTGILVLAADRNRVSDNRVSGNDSYGVAVANYCTALSLSSSECQALDIDPDSDFNRVVSNRVTGNGGNADPSVPSVFGVDLAWDLLGRGNCWARNVAGSRFPASLPACP